MNCASANKDSNELETNFNSGFLSFLGPNYTNKNSQKEKTIALNEHKRMEDVATKSRTSPNSRTYINYSFLFIWSPTCTHKERRKENTNAAK